MQNIKTTVKGNKLIIEVDLSKDLGVSQKGKAINVAMSGIFANIPGTGLSMNCNIIRKLNTDTLGNPLPVADTESKDTKSKA
ncbi:hypothetical protein ACP26L_36565 (plasmid) [Paenibacillus sp. S-38]|uniref:hypothetical protein n=1 Tax=Paenibacillus sp. S-38 TaxID=3416710 RepID=UPI003CED46D1